MNLKELLEQLRKDGLVGYPVKNDPPDSDSVRLELDGDLQAYNVAVRALGGVAVAIYSESLDADAFSYVPESRTRNEDDDELAGIDLAKIRPGLQTYKPYIGRQGLFYLSASLGRQFLDLRMEEPWWHDFWTIAFDAMDQVDREAEARRVETDQAADAGLEELLQRLNSFVDDPKFAKLPTQKAMRQYAIRKVPALRNVAESDLRARIQDLKATIDARDD